MSEISISTRIEELSQEKYDELISYINKAGFVGGCFGNRIYQIESVEEVGGNPPVYKGIKIRASGLIGLREHRERFIKSLSGLIDLLK